MLEDGKRIDPSRGGVRGKKETVLQGKRKGEIQKKRKGAKPRQLQKKRCKKKKANQGARGNTRA